MPFKLFVAAGLLNLNLMAQSQVIATTKWKPPVSPKQDELRRLCRKKVYVLAAGPRLCGKTISALNVLCDHAWNSPVGDIAIISVSQTVGFDSGVWGLLMDNIIPQWIKGGFGFDFVRRPFIQANSKKPTCIVTNKYGKTAKIQLESLKTESECEMRFKGRTYSMIYVPELSNFRERKTFSTWIECLRMFGLDDDKHLFLSDTNPSDEGTDSWIYKIWFELLNMDPKDVPEEDKPIRDKLGRLDYYLDDNCWNSPERIARLKSTYSVDPDLAARYLRGEWVAATTSAIFYSVFSPQRHVVGHTETALEPDPETLVPEPGCFELYTGSDLGVRNSATVIGEKYFRKEENGLTESCFKILDEIAILGEDFYLEDYVEQWLERMDFWEKVVGKPGRVVWRCYSDRNAFSTKDLNGRQFLNQLVYSLSDGRINLIGAWDVQRSGHSRGSVDMRIDITRQLLFSERIYTSGRFCPKTIEMWKGLKRKDRSLTGISVGSIHKHLFDAGSYWWASECYEEMNVNSRLKLRKLRRGDRQESLVQVGL